MAKFTFEVGDWANEIAKDYDVAGKAATGIMKMAVYEGANVVANKAKAAANAYGLGAGLGITKMETSADMVQVSVGFRLSGDAGYFTNRWGQRVPYDLVANVLEYGSSKVPATHFMTHAFKSAKAEAQSVMKTVFQEKIKQLIGD